MTLLSTTPRAVLVMFLMLGCRDAHAAWCWATGSSCYGGKVKQLAPGILYQRRTIKSKDFPSGPQVVHAVRIAYGQCGVRIVGSDKVSPYITTSQFAGAAKATVAINGDFGSDSTQPNGLWIHKGTLLHSDPEGESFIAVEPGGGGNKTKLHFQQTAVRLADKDIPKSWKYAIGGRPTVVWNGKAVAPTSAFCTKNGTLCSTNPRTATGSRSSSKGDYLFFVVVEGRRSDARGMTLTELGRLMETRLAADVAMNHDGGGSSALWLKGSGVVSRLPPGYSLRHLINHLAVQVFKCTSSGSSSDGGSPAGGGGGAAGDAGSAGADAGAGAAWGDGAGTPESDGDGGPLGPLPGSDADPAYPSATADDPAGKVGGCGVAGSGGGASGGSPATVLVVLLLLAATAPGRRARRTRSLGDR